VACRHCPTLPAAAAVAVLLWCREIWVRRPHEFKIACLQDIRALFPPEWNPFYAGFGNRDTDEVSYRCDLWAQRLQQALQQAGVYRSPKAEAGCRSNTQSNVLHSLQPTSFIT
jgi:hypothetical protein